MVVIIRGVTGANGLMHGDLSPFVDEEAAFHIAAATGNRNDVFTMTLFDKGPQVDLPTYRIVIPEKAEIIVYDFDASLLPSTWVGFSSNPAPIVDPPLPNSTALAYTYGNYQYDRVAQYDTMPPLSSTNNPANWTPRLFGGYCASPDYVVTSGLERNVVLACQDYTSRLPYTVCNKAYGPDALHPSGWSDQQMVRDLFNTYAGDIDTTFVSMIQAPGTAPALSFPTHTLAQMLGRIIKMSQGYYRLDYYKRLYYGVVGYQSAPFAINADAPNSMDVAYAPVVLADAPRGYYRLGDSSGTVALDASGNGRTGTYHGGVSPTASLIADPGSAGALFDGTSGYVQLPASTAWTLSALTLEAWIRTSATEWPGHGILVAQQQYSIYVQEGYLRSYDWGGGGWRDSGAFVADGLPHHVVMTIQNGVANGSTWYVDGMAVSTTTYTEGAGTPPPQIGAEGGYSLFPGTIQEAAIYSGVLSAARILAHYQAGKGTQAPTTAPEGLHYSPDAANQVDRVWVVGGTYQGPTQTYAVPPATWDGTARTCVLPAQLHNARSIAVSVAGVDQGTVGVLGIDGLLNNPTAWILNVIVGAVPPTLAFKTAPPSGAAVLVVGIFNYPLVQIVTDQAALSRLNNVAWEKVIKDIRVDSLSQATQIGQGYLALQKTAKPQGSCVIYEHAYNGLVLQPGQSINITSTAAFGGILPGGSTTLNAYITTLETELMPEGARRYRVTVGFSDRPDIQDGDLMDQMLGEQARVNAALAAGDVNDIVQDEQVVAEQATTGTTETVTATALSSGGSYTYDSSASAWEYSKWG